MYEFMLERFKGYSLERGFRADEFEAVLALKPARLTDFQKRLAAVQAFRQRPEAESLAAANKRIRNILRKIEVTEGLAVQAAGLQEAVEISLLQAALKAREDTRPLLQAGDYPAALLRLSSLKDSVDTFFDAVMVMCDDPVLRQNRLGLLAFIENLFLDIADISRLQA